MSCCTLRLLGLLGLVVAFETVEDDGVALNAANFDTVLAQNDTVLVHFWAPWSKKCETFRKELGYVAKSHEWSNIVHAKSDISDKRGYTSYLESYGVTKLPTLVLFRNAHPTGYPLDSPLIQSAVEKWLHEEMQRPAAPRNADDTNIRYLMMQEAQEGHRKARRDAENEERSHQKEEEQKWEKAKAKASAHSTSLEGAPAGKEEAPAGKEGAPAGKEEAPAGKEEAPAGKEEAPAEDEGEPTIRIHADATVADPQAASQAAPQAAPQAADTADPRTRVWHADTGYSGMLPEDAAEPKVTTDEARDSHRGESDLSTADMPTDLGEAAMRAAKTGVDGCVRLSERAISDSDFESKVLDKSADTFVLFYKPEPGLCAGNGSAYADFSDALVQQHAKLVQGFSMHVGEHKSPFVFEDGELPVVMLFPAKDKRPLEYSGDMTVDLFMKFAREHCGKMVTDEGAAATKQEL